MYYNMRKILLFVLLFLVSCGGAEVESTISQDSFDNSDDDTTTTTVRDTTTTTVRETTTIVSAQLLIQSLRINVMIVSICQLVI